MDSYPTIFQVPQLTVSEAGSVTGPVPDTGGLPPSLSQSQRMDTEVGVTADNSLGSLLAGGDERGIFSKSDNFLTRPDDYDDDSSRLLDRGRSPSLRKLRTTLMSHLGFGSRRHSSAANKKPVPTPKKSSLTVPAVQHSERRKARSKTSGEALEGSFSRQRGREGMGSFVMVMKQDPEPEAGVFLEVEYVKKLEENFRLNHMFGSGRHN